MLRKLFLMLTLIVIIVIIITLAFLFIIAGDVAESMNATLSAVSWLGI